MEDKRALDDIVAAACQADGSITGAAEILDISKQAVSKRLRSVRVLHEIWTRANGNGAASKAIQKGYADDFVERVEKSTAREARQYRRAQDRVDLYEGKHEELTTRMEEAAQWEEDLLAQATDGDVDAVSEEVSKVRATRDTLKSVVQNTSVLIGEARMERDDKKKKLEAAVRRAVLAFREDATADLVERLEAIQAQAKAFERSVIEGLNGMKENGLPVSSGIMGLYETSILMGDEIDTAIRDLRRRLNAGAVAAEQKARSEAYEAKFKSEKPRTPNVKGELVQL